MSEKVTIDEIAELERELGPTLVAFTAGSRDRKIVDKWLESSAYPSPEEIARLACALQHFRRVAVSQSTDIARAWFIGASVSDGEEKITPAEAIRNDNFNGVRISATRMINDEWD